MRLDRVLEQQGGAFMPLGDALKRAAQLCEEGRLVEAEAVCRRTLEAQPNAPDAEHLLGLIAHQMGKIDQAIEHLQRAVELAPGVAAYHANLGEMFRLAGSPEIAANEARRALAINPAMPTALTNLGLALYETEDFDGAVHAHRQAIAAQPNFSKAHSNLGNALRALKRFDEAIAAYRRAIELDPSFADAWANLGNTLQNTGDYQEAVPALRQAIALAPGNANARSGLGLILLLRGELAEGWYENEWRLRASEQKAPRFPQRPWQGENLNGKHIYVQAEQGLGDTIQFVRYFALLAERGCKITARVQPSLIRLMRESFPSITIMEEGSVPPPYDIDAALLSLPHLLKTRLETIPAHVPYLHPAEQTIWRWKERFAPLESLKVGVAWAGNPRQPNDFRRSLDASVFAPLFAVRGTYFASLQVGPRAADLAKLQNHKPAIDLSPDLTDFSEAAGAIAALDLVITVDTSIAHLAGALGKPVWVLLSWAADWRWMLDCEESRWYPTMRLFRQRKGQGWAEVLAGVAEQLNAVVNGNPTVLTPFKALGEHRAATAAAIIAAETVRTVAAPAVANQTLTASPALILADKKRRDGLLGEATELCRRILTAEPANAGAEHLLGVIAHQSGKLLEAIEHLRCAIAIDPNVADYHANLGEMCRLAGRIEEAIAASRRALAIQPDNPNALNNLGIALFDQGKFAEALVLYERAIAAQENARAHSNRGNALQRLQRFPEAELAYRRALELNPKFVDAWNNLGTCLRELKRPAEAEAVYRKALELGPNHPDTLDNLALALNELERPAEAAELLRRALAIAPRSETLHVHYGATLLTQDKIEEAAEASERAIALNSNNYDAANLMGRVAFKRGNLQSAADHFRRALVLKPDFVDAYNNLGNALKEQGRLQDAIEAHSNAIALDPSNVGVYFNLADSKKFTPGDAHLVAMEALAARSDLSTKDRTQLEFALGKAYADVHDYQRSFAYLLSANATKRATISYDEKTVLTSFDRIAAVFTAELIATKSGLGDPSPMPIFIIGMPRSGTTLIEQIIASHPMVYGAGELQVISDMAKTIRGVDGGTVPYPEFLPSLNAAALSQIGAQYISSLCQLLPESARNCQRVTDKMPSNYFFAGLIHLALPNAKIIHIVRDPVDTCLSCFTKLFASEQNHTYDLGELGRYYRRYQRLMEHWHRVLPAGRILDVRYEEVIADLEREARRVIAHCGLAWDERCLAFYTTDRPVRTASAAQVRQPIYNSAVGRWRAYKNDLGPLLDALGVSELAGA
jgi:tetratricopeptide (TPR) repeat protein